MRYAMWNKISNSKSIYEFMTKIHNFHDSCIKEIRYISGAWVDEELSMFPLNNINSVDIVFQRQYEDPCALVMRFADIDVLHLAPINTMYTCEISDATMFIKNNLIFWVEDKTMAEENIQNCRGTWISAKEVFWKTTNFCIGKDIIYHAKYEEV